MKIGNEEIDKNLVIYFVVAIILSGLLGFYGGRFFERNNFRKMTKGRQNSGRQFPGRAPGEIPQNPQSGNVVPENTEPKSSEDESTEKTTNDYSPTDQGTTDKKHASRKVDRFKD